MPVFPPWRVVGAATVGALGTPHNQQQSLIVLLAPHQGKVGEVVTPPRPWTTFGALCRGFNQQDLPCQSFVGHSGHVAEPT